MTDDIAYCATGCTRLNANQERERAHARIGHLCRSCFDRLDRWLVEIPHRYALLPEYLLPSADLDANPESKPTKRQHAPAPIRLAALDLLDERLGRKWLGTVAADERRGTLGTLLAIANAIRADRGSDTKTTSYVVTEADYLRTSLEHLAADDAIADTYAELKQLHRELGDAVGQYPPRSVGPCYLVPETAIHDEHTCECGCHLEPDADCTIPADADEPNCGPGWAREHACAGAILPTPNGAFCVKCGNRWDHLSLRRMGLGITDQEASA